MGSGAAGATRTVMAPMRGPGQTVGRQQFSM